MHRSLKYLFILLLVVGVKPIANAHGVPDPVVLRSMIQWCAKNRPDLRDAEEEMHKRMSGEERLFFSQIGENLKRFPDTSALKGFSEAELQSFCDGLKQDLSKSIPAGVAR